jgi:hypothetical protein
MSNKEKSTSQKTKAKSGAVATSRGRSDGLNLWGFYATLGGWLLLFLGQRVVVEPEGLVKMLSGLGVVMLLAALVQRGMALSEADADRKGAARAFAILNALSLLALGGFYASTDAGRAMFGIAPAKLSETDLYGDAMTVAWTALVFISLLPMVLGEMSRRSMRNAEKVESRRVIAAVVAGLSLACAACYSALFVYAAGQSDVSADHSYFRVSKPSEMTRRMVAQLNDPLTVLVFFPHTTDTRAKVMRYLNDLKSGNESKLKVEMHDFYASPALAKKHKITKDGVLVLVRGKMSQKLSIDVKPQRAKRKLRRLDGEFQKVLTKLMRDKRTLYLTVGHGELNESTDKRSGRSATIAKKLIERQNYGVKKLGLAEGLGKEIPKDAHAVMVLGPKDAFSEPEIESLQRYVAEGGKLFMALDPEYGADHGKLAASVGVKWTAKTLADDRIRFPMTRTKSDKKVLVVRSFSSHASVTTMMKYARAGKAVIFSGAAPLEKLADGGKELRFDRTLKSERQSYVDLNGNLAFDSDSEKQKVYSVGVSLSRKLGTGKDAVESKVVVYGDADAVSDRILGFAATNQILFGEVLRWLGGEESFTGTQSSEEDVPIVHTKSQDQAWFYGSIVAVPALVLGAGLMLTRRRSGGGPARPGKPKPRPQQDTPEATASTKTEDEEESAEASDKQADDEDGEEEENEA